MSRRRTKQINNYKAIEEQEYEAQMQEAKARQEAAEKRIKEAKQTR
jgi:hypothetical protein